MHILSLHAVMTMATVAFALASRAHAGTFPAVVRGTNLKLQSLSGKLDGIFRRNPPVDGSLVRFDIVDEEVIFARGGKAGGGHVARVLAEGDTCQSVSRAKPANFTMCSEDRVKHPQIYPSEITWCCEDPELSKCTPNICGANGCQSRTDLYCFCDDELLEWNATNGQTMACDEDDQSSLRDSLFPFEAESMQAYCCSWMALGVASYKQKERIGKYAPNDKSLSISEALISDVKILGSQICENAYPGGSRSKVCTDVNRFITGDGIVALSNITFVHDPIWCCKEDEVCASCNTLGSFGCFPAETVACECVVGANGEATLPDRCSQAEVNFFGAEHCCTKKNNWNSWFIEQMFKATTNMKNESARQEFLSTLLHENATDSSKTCFDIQPDGVLSGIKPDTKLCMDRNSADTNIIVSNTGNISVCCVGSEICYQTPTQCVGFPSGYACLKDADHTFCGCSVGQCKGRNCCTLAKYPFLLVLGSISWLAFVAYVRSLRPLIIKMAVDGPFDFSAPPRRIGLWGLSFSSTTGPCQTSQTIRVDNRYVHIVMFNTFIMAIIGPLIWLIFFIPIEIDTVPFIYFILGLVAACLTLTLLAADYFRYFIVPTGVKKVYESFAERTRMNKAANIANNDGTSGQWHRAQAYETLDEETLVPGESAVEMSSTSLLVADAA